MEHFTEIARIVVPEVVDIDVIKNEIGPAIDKMLTRADALVPRVSAAVKDNESRDLARREAEHLRDNGKDILDKYREAIYMEQIYRPGEKVRLELFDNRLKRIVAHMKTLLGSVSEYNERKDREAAIAKERAEAEARRQREESERKQREAVAAEARAKQAAEDEKKRKLEAEDAEKRRVAAEAEAQERRDREAREAAAAETKRKLQEAEEAQIKQAQVAHDEGNGAAKVDTILETPKPISTVLGKAESAGDAESVRLEQENARKVTEEKARREREEAAAAEAKRKEAEAEAFRLRQEADAEHDAGTTAYQRYVWDLESDGTELGDIAAVMAILREVLDGRKPIEYIGFNRKRPQDWRPSIIGEEVSDKKERFVCPGVRAYPQRDDRLKRRVVGGRR